MYSESSSHTSLSSKRIRQGTRKGKEGLRTIVVLKVDGLANFDIVIVLFFLSDGILDGSALYE